MAARSIATATISFGLVTVPVRIYPATRQSAGLSFHLLHAKDNVRLNQQYVCPKDGEVVSRKETVKGYEYRKGRYVVFTNEELKALDERASSGIEIREFVAADTVDPVYFERTYYLGPDEGGEKGYSLLAQAMADAGQVAVAQYAARGKSYLVLVRSTGDRLSLQQLYHSDEVRAIDEVPATTRRNSEAEVRLARQLIEHIREEAFRPEKYEDEVRRRIERAIQDKVKGKDITIEAEPRKKAEVVDIMEALKASLARKGGAAATRGSSAARGQTTARARHARVGRAARTASGRR